MEIFEVVIMEQKQKFKKLQNKIPIIESGSLQEQQYLAQLRNEIMRTDDDFIQYVQDDMQRNEINDSQIDMMNSYYNRMLMMQCVRPLSQGLNASSIVQTIGMYAGLCLFSPDFKRQCHKSIQNVIYPEVARRAEMAGPDSKWAKRKNAIIKEQNGGRLPLTPKSAALQQIAFAKRFYHDCREPNANIEQLTAQYDMACHVLQKQAEQDCLDFDEIITNQHIILGQLLERDPEIAVMFDGLATKDIKRSDYQQKKVDYINESGVTETRNEFVWTGEFETSDGKSFNKMFQPRRPTTKNGYSEKVTDLMQSMFQGRDTLADLEHAWENGGYKEKMSNIINLMLADNFDLDDINDTCGSKMDEYRWHWVKTHPEEAAREAAKRRAEQNTSSNNYNQNYKEEPWDNTEQQNSNTSYELEA